MSESATSPIQISLCPHRKKLASRVNLRYPNAKTVQDDQFRSSCTKAKEENHRKLMVNEKWEQQKEYVKTKLSDEKTGSIYRQRKIEVEPVFGFLKASLRFTRFSVRGKSRVKTKWALR